MEESTSWEANYFFKPRRVCVCLPKQTPRHNFQTAINKGRINSDIVYPNLIIKDPVFVINIYRSLKVSLIVDLKVELGLMEED
jgi:hypothetical protein